MTLLEVARITSQKSVDKEGKYEPREVDELLCGHHLARSKDAIHGIAYCYNTSNVARADLEWGAMAPLCNFVVEGEAAQITYLQLIGSLRGSESEIISSLGLRGSEIVSIHSASF